MKKVLVRTAIVIGVLLIFLTFLSKTIESMLLPKVEVTAIAKEELSNAVKIESTAVYLDEAHKIIYDFPLKVLEIFVEEKSTIQAGDIIMQVDIEEYEIQQKQMELDLLRLINARADWWNYTKKALAELDMEIEILQEQIEHFKKGYPEDGFIYAPMSGILHAIPVKEGLFGSGIMAEIVDSDQLLYAKVPLRERDIELYSEQCSVSFEYTAIINVNGSEKSTLMRKSSAVEKKEFDVTENKYFYYVPLGRIDNMAEGAKITVILKNSLGLFEKVLPLSAVSVDASGRLFVYVLGTRNGLFGEENYVKQVFVEEIGKTQLKIAVDSQDLWPDSQVVISTEGDLTPGQTVRVKGK